jgi:pyruvate ferredoxin oxidoreductase alpha subunit
VVTTDGFIISHGMERIEALPDGEVKSFVGEYKPEYYLLNFDKPITMGALDLQDYYFEHKRQEVEAIRQSQAVIEEVGREFAALSGRSYGLFEEYRLKDADLAIIAMGSTAGTAKDVIDGLRNKGVKAGLVKPRVYRPFPKYEIAAALKGLKAIAVMDRSDSLNAHEGPLCLEVKGALYDIGVNKTLINYIYGLGGRDIKISEIEAVFVDLAEAVKGSKIDKVNYLGVRE